jgi:hypothetical protein
MNVRFWFLAITLACVLYTPRVCLGDVPSTVTVRGKVLKAQSSSVAEYPLSDVRVWLLSGEGTEHAVVGSGFTDSAGIFYIPRVAPGRYVLQFWLVKNLLGQYQIVVPSDPASFHVSPEDPSIQFFDVAPVYLNSPTRF